MTVAIAAEPCAACKKRQARRPQGYLAHAEWAERMMKRYHQEQCTTCGYWTIWRRGASNQESGSVLSGEGASPKTRPTGPEASNTGTKPK